MTPSPIREGSELTSEKRSPYRHSSGRLEVAKQPAGQLGALGRTPSTASQWSNACGGVVDRPVPISHSGKLLIIEISMCRVT